MYGKERVALWRRGFAIRPPPVSTTDPRHPAFDLRYSDLKREDLPATESLEDTLARAMPYWNGQIAPAITANKRILVVAHGNSIRALIKYLDTIPDDEIAGLNIPTGFPLVYELDDSLHPVCHHYLGDPEEIRRAHRLQARTPLWFRKIHISLRKRNHYDRYIQGIRYPGLIPG